MWFSFVHIVIDVLLKLQIETYLFMKSPPNKILTISHEVITISWEKYMPIW